MLARSSTHPALPAVESPRAYHEFTVGKRGEPNFIMSRTELKRFAACPRRWLIGTERETSDAMDWGSLVDCVALTPKSFESVYAIAPETYPATPKKKDDPIEEKPWNWNAKHCQSWREDQEEIGKTVIKSGDASEAWKAVQRLRDEPFILAFLMASQTQVWVNVEWQDEETGIIVPVKCLLDLAPDPKSEFGDTLGDLKTTANASYRAWCKQVHNEGWHVQAALYMDAYNVVTGLKYRNFEHIISENFAPYEPTHRPLSAEFLTLGRSEYQRQLQQYCQCLKNKSWPGYDTAMTDLESWMIL